MILLKITGKLASTPPTYDLLARDYFSLTVLLTARLQCGSGWLSSLIRLVVMLVVSIRVRVGQRVTS